MFLKQRRAKHNTGGSLTYNTYNTYNNLKAPHALAP